METVSELTKIKIIDENPEMTQEQLNAALDMMEKFQGFGVIAAFILIFSLFFGFLTFGGWFDSKKRVRNKSMVLYL